MSLVRLQVMHDPSSTVHIAIGHALGAALDGLVSPLVVVNDNLLLGPSSTDTRRHQALRARYWNVSPFPDLDDEGGPLCVYLPPTACGLLTACRLCSLATHQQREILVVDLGAKSPAWPAGGVGAEPAQPPSPESLDPAPEAVFDAAALLQQGPPPTRWSELQAALAATVWALWCRRSPTAFSRFCAAGSKLHPLISDLSRYHAGMFPRLAGDGLRLARFDELLLRQLSGEWSTPVQLFVKAMKAGSELEAWISHTGDLIVAARLQAWWRHTRGRVVERRREHPANPSDMTQWSFRWRPGGEAILERLPSLDAAPPIRIGGAVAYDPDRPWISCVGDAGPYVRAIHRFRRR